MCAFVLAFLLGILTLQQFSHLPAERWVWVIAVIIAILLPFRRSLKLAIACMAGFAWCLWFAHLQTSWTLPENFEGKTVQATGYISSIPNPSLHGTEFLFNVKKLQLENDTQTAHGLLHLNWQGGDVKNLHVGDKWRLAVRLKKIHGTMNPGGFDYEAWALQEKIHATGYVYNKGENQLISHHWYHYSLARSRAFLKEKIAANLPASNTSPWITALALGERQNISAENWEVLRNTGTNHLMAIAGLHIGFMSGVAYFIVAWLWRRKPKLAFHFPAQHAGAIAAMLMTLIYSALAGFSLPTQRACLMLMVFLIFSLMRRKISAWYAWSTAMLIVLLINPLSVLSESFWLSFGAVALIIYGVSARLAPKGLWWKWGRMQWVIGVGLIPFSIWLFQQCSIVSFVANSIAIPWVGFIVVPLCLLGCFTLLFSAKLGGFILIFADKILSVLWIILTWLSHLSWASWYQVMPNIGVLIAACIGIIILLLPVGFPGRWLGVIGLLPLLMHQAPTPKSGDIKFTLLDVGQGLSTVVQTQNHLLVFDAGAKLSANFDMGESVVVPYLRSISAKKIDMMVISHGDNDHIGGASAILKHFPVSAVKTSVPQELHANNTSYCLRGESWNWDGVNFEFLYPAENTLGFDNDSSCVLKISNGQKSILLTGDIEKYAENNLVTYESKNLAANILVAPHHGSKTSAEDDFLQDVKPNYVLFPVGYRNRYHFPHADVIAKYDALGVQKLDTVRSGAITFLISANGMINQPILYRVVNHHYWNN